MAIDVLSIDIDQVREVDSVAADILYSAVQAINAILKCRQQMDLEGQQDEPLYVFSGESHDRPVHHLFNLLVLNGLVHAEEKLIVAHEVKSDLFFANIQKQLSDVYEQIKNKTNPIILGTIQQGLAADINFYREAAYAHSIINNSIMGLVETDSLIAVFNDFPERRNMFNATYLDAIENITEFTSWHDKVIARNMRNRNYFMHNMLTDLAQNNNTRIAFQLCGQAHIKAGPESYCDEEHGFLAIYNRHAQNALPLYLSSQSSDDNKQLGIDIRLPDKKKAYYNPITGKKFRWSIDDFVRKPDLNSYSKEKAYVDGLLDSLGLPQLKRDLKFK